MDLKIFPTVEKIAQKRILHAHLEMTVQEVSKLMQQENVSSVVITNTGRYSIISIEDLLQYLNAGGQGTDALANLPEHHLVSIKSDQHILSALELLNNCGDRYLAVENLDGSLLGIMTYTDLLSAADPSLLVENKTLGELISRSIPIAFSSDWFLEDVLCHFKKLEDSIVIVEDGLPLGIITTKDVFRIVATGEAVGRPISEYMTKPVVTAKSSSTINEAFTQLKNHRIKRLVVVNELNKLAGVITQSELVGFVYGSWITLSKHHSGELRELVSMLDHKASEIHPEQLLDPISGLGNRQMLLIETSLEIDRIHRYGCPPFCLLLIKFITESHQPQAPDLIRDLTGKLLNSIRALDRLLQWDDQTFALLLPQTQKQQAENLISRVEAVLAETPLSYAIDYLPFEVDESGSQFIDRITNLQLT